MEPANNTPFDCFIRECLQKNRLSPIHQRAAQSATKVKAFLENNKLWTPLLNSPDTPYQITPLHLAAMRGDAPCVEALINLGASVIAQDGLGNTPAHLAAFRGAWGVVTILREAAKTRKEPLEEIQNHQLATLDTLEKITKPPIRDPQKEVAHMRNQEGNLVPVSSELYQTLTKTIFCNYVIYPPEDLQKRWIRSGEYGIKKDLYVEKIWKNFNANPPQLYLEEQRLGESKISLGLGVRAGETIPMLTLLSFYGGEHIPPEKAPLEPSDYKMLDIEANRYSNIAALFNDGFPVACSALLNAEGYFNGCGLFSISPIQKGEILTLHYGIHSCKFGYYELLHQEKLEQFCTRQNFESIEKKLHRVLPADSKFVVLTTLISLLAEQIMKPAGYLLETPKALIHCVTKGLVKVADLRYLENFLASYHPFDTEGYAGVLNTWRHTFYLQLELAERDLEFQKRYFSFLKSLSPYRVIAGMFGMQLLDFKMLFITYHTNKELNEQLWASKEALVKLLDHFLTLAPDVEKNEECKQQLREIHTIILKLLLKPFQDPEFFRTLISVVYTQELGLKVDHILNNTRI